MPYLRQVAPHSGARRRPARDRSRADVLLNGIARNNNAATQQRTTTAAITGDACTMSIDILAFGEALVEFNQQPDDPARYLQGFGGDTSNFCIAAARQGARAGYISAVGEDTFGERLLALWTQER